MMLYDRSGASLPDDAFPLSDFIDRAQYVDEYTDWYKASIAFKMFLTARPRWLPPRFWYRLPSFGRLKHQHEAAFRTYMTAYRTEWHKASKRRERVLREYTA